MAFKMRGFPKIGSPMQQKQDHEGKKTISGDRLKELEPNLVNNLPQNIDGSADYFYTGQTPGPIEIHGIVEIGGGGEGRVTGVPGNVPGELTREVR